MYGIVGTISVSEGYNLFSSLSVTVTRSGGGLYCHYNDTFTVLEKISNKYQKMSIMLYHIINVHLARAWHTSSCKTVRPMTGKHMDCHSYIFVLFLLVIF